MLGENFFLNRGHETYSWCSVKGGQNGIQRCEWWTCVRAPEVLRLLTYNALLCQGTEEPSRATSPGWWHVLGPLGTSGRCPGRSPGARSRTGSPSSWRRRGLPEGEWWLLCWFVEWSPLASTNLVPKLVPVDSKPIWSKLCLVKHLASSRPKADQTHQMDHTGNQDQSPREVKELPVSSLRTTVGPPVGQPDRDHLHWALLEVFSATSQDPLSPFSIFESDSLVWHVPTEAVLLGLLWIWIRRAHSCVLEIKSRSKFLLTWIEAENKYKVSQNKWVLLN